MTGPHTADVSEGVSTVVRGIRTVVAALAGGALLAGATGCSMVSGRTAAPAVPASSTPTAAGSATPARVLTVATPRPRTPAPALRTTGTAWPAVLASLAGYGQWLLANPDPALTGGITAPGCAMADLLAEQTAGLLRDRAYVKPSAPVFTSIAGPSPAPGATAAVIGGEVVLDVTASRPAEPVVSRTGRPITSFEALPATALQITLYRGADQRWRFCTVDAMDDAGAPDDPSVPLL